jgi:hypothetical protein
MWRGTRIHVSMDSSTESIHIYRILQNFNAMGFFISPMLPYIFPNLRDSLVMWFYCSVSSCSMTPSSIPSSHTVGSLIHNFIASWPNTHILRLYSNFITLARYTFEKIYMYDTGAPVCERRFFWCSNLNYCSCPRRKRREECIPRNVTFPNYSYIQVQYPLAPL